MKKEIKLVVLIIIMILSSCMHRGNDCYHTSVISYQDTLFMCVPADLKYSYQDTFVDKNQVFHYFANRKKIYHGTVNDSYQVPVVKDSLNIYIEVVSKRLTQVECEKGLKHRIQSIVGGYDAEIIDTVANSASLLTSDQFFGLKRISKNGNICHCLFYYAFNYKSEIDSDFHIYSWNGVKNSFKYSSHN